MKDSWQAVFFDFDGVILDSVDVKTRAFAKMFRQYGHKIEKAVVDYHLANGGISRFDKFEYYYKKLLNKPVNQKVLDQLGEQFKQLINDEVMDAPFIRGALETLEYLKNKEIPCFVVTGPPNEEIQSIVAKRNINHYFLEVHGSPRNKPEIVKEISVRYNLVMENCLFIGDAMTDYQASLICGTKFLGIVGNNSSCLFPDGVMVSSSVHVQLS